MSKVLICRIFIFTNKINNNTSIGEASSGAFEETILPVWWVICLVFCNCLDVIVVARIHRGVAEYEQGRGLF